MSFYSIFDSIRTTFTGGIPCPPPPPPVNPIQFPQQGANRPLQMQLEQRITKLKHAPQVVNSVASDLILGRVLTPVDFLEKSVKQLYQFHPVAAPLIPYGKNLTESKENEAYEQFHTIYNNTVPYRFAFSGIYSKEGLFQKELINFYKIVENLKANPDLTIPPNFSYEAKYAVMKTSGADELKKKFAEYEKARILSLPVADCNNDIGVGYNNICLELVFKALPSPSYEEVVELLKRLPQRQLTQAMSYLDSVDNVLNKETFQRAIKEVFDQKSLEFKKTEAQFVLFSLQNEDSKQRFCMLGEELLHDILQYA